MNRYWLKTTFGLVLLGGVFALPDFAAQAADKVKGYDAYALVKTRNIFDPNRRAITRLEQRSTTLRVRANNFTLTGTMVAGGRSLAFFNGSRSEYSKVAVVGDHIANFKIAAVTPLQVELEADGKRQVLAVGRQLQLEGSTTESSEPEPPVDPNAPVAPAADGTQPPPPTIPSAPPAAAGGDKAEILRRMMEKRQKEMSK